MADLEIFDDGETLYVDSRLIAERLGIQHDSFFRNLNTYQTSIEQAFGIIRFEIEKLSGPGRPPRYAYLTEDQATFAMTLSANTDAVVQCKIDLVSAFSKAKQLLKRRQQETVYQVPYWYQRIRLAMGDTERPLQSGYFCAYEQMMSFFTQLEGRLGYVIPDLNPVDGKYLVPDISIGKKFNEFLRSDDEVAIQARQQFLGSPEEVDFRQPGMRKDGWFDGGSHYREIQIYNHVYPTASHGKYQVQEANSYPTRYLSIFQHHLQEYWIPDACIPYLKRRDPQGVKFLRAAINELPPTARKTLSGTLIGKLAQSLPPA